MIVRQRVTNIIILIPLVTISILLVEVPSSFSSEEVCSHIPSFKVRKGETDEVKVEENTLILKRTDLPIVIKCVSTLPVEWKFTGMAPSKNPFNVTRYKEFVNPGETLRILKECYVSQLKITSFSKDHIGRYGCFTPDFSSSTSLNIFLSEDNEKPYYLNEGSKMKVQPRRFDNEIILPCPVSEPSEDFAILRFGGWTPKKEKFRLEPTKGFVIELPSGTAQDIIKYVGDYRCIRAGDNEDESHNVDVEVLHPINYYIQPDVGEIKTRSGFTVKCSSTSEVTMEVKGDVKRVSITYLFNPDNFYTYTATLEYSEIPPGETGQISCLRPNKQVIHTWYYKHLDFEGGLTFDSRPGVLVCEAENDNALQFKVAFCTYPDGCVISSNGAQNPFTIQVCGEGCNQMKAERFGGYRFNCDADGISTTDLLFFGLDSRFYAKFEEIPTEAKIRITEHTTSGNEGSEIVVSCEWVPFFLSDSVTWTLELLNGSLIPLEPDLQDFSETERGSRVSTVQVSSLAFPSKKCTCHVAAWNVANSWAISSIELDVDLEFEEIIHGDSLQSHLEDKHSKNSYFVLFGFAMVVLLNILILLVIFAFVAWWDSWDSSTFTETNCSKGVSSSIQNIQRYHNRRSESAPPSSEGHSVFRITDFSQSDVRISPTSYNIRSKNRRSSCGRKRLRKINE